MEIIIDRGCGLNVHKGIVVGCIMRTEIKKEIRTYTTMTNDLLRLKGLLQESGITHVAMENTGIYWKPVFNILEDLVAILGSKEINPSIFLITFVTYFFSIIQTTRALTRICLIFQLNVYRLYSPDVFAIFPDGSVRGKPTHTGYG